MAFVVERSPARRSSARRFEVRESVTTDDGPRARTLATFTELDDVVLAKARARALRPFVADDVVASARRLGAPMAHEPAVERYARALIAEIEAGNRPPPVLAALLARSLAGAPDIDDNVEAAAQWIGADADRRGEVLADLLELADAIPPGSRRPDRPTFPRIASR